MKIKEKNILNETGEVISTVPQIIEKLLEVDDLLIIQMPGFVKNEDYIRSNVWCFDKKGKKIWEVEPVKSATKYDSYSNTYIQDGKLFVVSGSGISSEIDIQTGKILNTEFLK
jgi:outer membrane protein assembly factor BamB